MINVFVRIVGARKCREPIMKLAVRQSVKPSRMVTITLISYHHGKRPPPKETKREFKKKEKNVRSIHKSTNISEKNVRK
jgi:hypothetical protein